MDNRLHIHRNALSKSDSAPVSSHFQTRPNAFQAKQPSQRPLTQTEIENQEFQQHKFEATKLEIQAKYGTITPLGQERLTVLQAKMSGLLQKRVENASSFGHSLTKIALKRPGTTPPPIQTKLTIGQPGDKYEQEADRVASQVVNQINAPAPQQSAQSQNIQREALPSEEDELMMKPEISTIQREEVPEEEEELQMKPMVQLAQLQATEQSLQSATSTLAYTQGAVIHRAPDLIIQLTQWHKKNLTNHYTKHSSDAGFAYKDEAAYGKAAIALVDSPPTSIQIKPMSTDPSKMVYYDNVTDSFAIVAGGNIITFFQPGRGNSSIGQKYFDKQ